MPRWDRRASKRRVYLASRRGTRKSPRAAGGLGTSPFQRGGRLRGCVAFRLPLSGPGVALLPSTWLAHSSDPSGHSSYGLSKYVTEGDIAESFESSYFFSSSSPQNLTKNTSFAKYRSTTPKNDLNRNKCSTTTYQLYRSRSRHADSESVTKGKAIET